MLVVAHISERNVNDLEIGGEAAVEFSRQATRGKISFISHAADPITRTYRVEIEIVNTDFALRDGLSAKVLLPRAAIQAHRVTPALLSLNDAGEIGIKIVDERNEVKFVQVDIVSDTTEGIWLTGLPQLMQVITLGQGLVFDGQVVDVVPVDAMTALKANLPKVD
jgi:multidrug efflux system membrane fusion protein